MSRKIGLQIVYGFIAATVLIVACSGIGVAETTEIKENVYRTTGDTGEDDILYVIFDDATSTMRNFDLWSLDGISADSVEDLAQKRIDTIFGATITDHKSNWVQSATADGFEILLFDKKTGKKQIDLSVHCLLLGACEGISAKEWEAYNVVISPGNPLTTTLVRDVKAQTVRELLHLASVQDVDHFQTFAKAQINDNLGSTTKDGYTYNWIQVAAPYGDEILLMSQKKGEDMKYLSIPSFVDFSEIMNMPRSQTSVITSEPETPTIFTTCKEARDTRICGHMKENKEKYPDLTTCFDYCMYETLRIPQTWDEFKSCLRLQCKALFDSPDKIQLNNADFMKDLQYVWTNLQGIW